MMEKNGFLCMYVCVKQKPSVKKVHFFGFLRLVLGQPPLPGCWYTKIKKNWWLFRILDYYKKLVFTRPPAPLFWKLSQVYTKFCHLFWQILGGGSITSWIDKISPPPIYVLCVSSHLWTFPMKFFLENFTKSWYSFEPPLHLVQNTKFFFFQK